MVSTSIPEKPKALSPSMHITLLPEFSARHQIAAAIAKPKPTPIVPNVPASSLKYSTSSTTANEIHVRKLFFEKEFPHNIIEVHNSM